MDFFGSALIQELGCLTKLCTADDGVIDQKQLFVFDQGMYRDQLHAGDQFSLTLVRRHKGTRPGRCIFNERTGERNAGFIGISDSMCDTGVWDTGYDIRIYFSFISFCQQCTAVITHFFYVYAFVTGSRITIVNPQERTDFHFLARRNERFHTLRGDVYNLAGT